MGKRLTVYHKALAAYKKRNPDATHAQAIKAYQTAKRSFERETKSAAKASKRKYKGKNPLPRKHYRGELSKREFERAWSVQAVARTAEPLPKQLRLLQPKHYAPHERALVRSLQKQLRGNEEAKEALAYIFDACPAIIGKRKHFKKADLRWMKAYLDAAGVPIGAQMQLFRTFSVWAKK